MPFVKAALPLLSLVFLFTTAASATPLSFTGAEFINLPGVSFPSGTRTIVGDSVRFDSTIDNAVMYRLPLDGFVVDRGEISFSLSFTRLLTDFGSVDFDFYVGIFDGQSAFGSFFINSDTASDRALARSRNYELTPDETFLSTILSGNQGSEVFFPAGQTRQTQVSITQTPSGNNVIGSINGAGGATLVTGNSYDPNGSLSLILVGNQPFENYLFNSLTFTSGVALPEPQAVPEPGALAGLGLGLLGLGLRRRRMGLGV